MTTPFFSLCKSRFIQFISRTRNKNRKGKRKRKKMNGFPKFKQNTRHPSFHVNTHDSLTKYPLNLKPGVCLFFFYPTSTNYSNLKKNAFSVEKKSKMMKQLLFGRTRNSTKQSNVLLLFLNFYSIVESPSYFVGIVGALVLSTIVEVKFLTRVL